MKKIMTGKTLTYKIILICCCGLISSCNNQMECEKSKFYFPLSVEKNANYGLDTFVNKWYSSQLIGMNEPKLLCSTNCDNLRLTYLPSMFNPEIFRIEKCGKVITGFYKKSNAQDEYELGKIIESNVTKLNMSEWISINEKYRELKENRVSNEESAGTDGSQWIIERKIDSDYDYIDRWSIEFTKRDPELFEFCQTVMKLVK